MTQSSFCTVRHPVLTFGKPTACPQPGRLPRLGILLYCCKSACIEHQCAIGLRTSCGSVLLRYGLNFSTAWWTLQSISGEKDWKYVSVQKVVTLNTSCDVACLTFQLLHFTKTARRQTWQNFVSSINSRTSVKRVWNMINKNLWKAISCRSKTPASRRQRNHGSR